MFKKRVRGQSWSLDIILAFVVFVLIIGIFYSLLSNNKKDQTRELSLESKTVISNLEIANGQNSNLSIIGDGSISNSSLGTLYVSDYEGLKKELGIRGDFCIYLVDQYGKITTVKTPAGDVGSFGSSNFTLNGKSCGSALP